MRNKIGDIKVIKLKIAGNILDLDDKDLILDNEACYQVVTQKAGKGFNWYYPVMSNDLFNGLKELELVFTNEELRQNAIRKYGDKSRCTYWKFDIERMQKLGY
jgi:hypothetical protein